MEGMIGEIRDFFRYFFGFRTCSNSVF